MITVKLQGGLGNQMFQYAFGRAKSLEEHTGLALDMSHYQRAGSRSFELDQFNIHASVARVPWFRRFFNFKNSYVEGYWQSETYFKNYADIVRADFTLKKPLSAGAQKIAMAMKASDGAETVSVHIRRGDYLSPKHTRIFSVCGQEYYEAAMKIIAEKVANPRYFVFSDDIAWAQTLPFSYGTVFIKKEYGLEPCEELVLMSRAQHHIIANSSFSWWGAWLGTNPNKIVIAPKKYYKDESVNTSDWTPPSWIRI